MEVIKVADKSNVSIPSVLKNWLKAKAAELSTKNNKTTTIADVVIKALEEKYKKDKTFPDLSK